MGRICISKGGPGRQRGWGRWRAVQWPPWQSSPPPPRTSLPPKSIVKHKGCRKRCFQQLFENICTNLPDYHWLSCSKEGQQDEVDRESSAMKKKKRKLTKWESEAIFCIFILHSEGPDAGHGNDDGKAGNGRNSKSNPVHCCWLISSQENTPLHGYERQDFKLSMNLYWLDIITLVESNYASECQNKLERREHRNTKIFSRIFLVGHTWTEMMA